MLSCMRLANAQSYEAAQPAVNVCGFDDDCKFRQLLYSYNYNMESIFSLKKCILLWDRYRLHRASQELRGEST